MRTCTSCKIDKPAGDFVMQKYGLSASCSECRNEYVKEYKRKRPDYHRKNMLMKQYGITIAEFDALVVKQEGRCAACGSTESGMHNSKHLCVDHNHETGEVRGLLCSPCNLTLGNAKESIERLQGCAVYLIERGDYS